MTAPLPASGHASLDLAGDPPLAEGMEMLRRLELPAARIDSVRAATGDEEPRERSRRLGEIFRKLEPGAAIELLTAGGRLALEHDLAGLRLLLGFLEVKRPGAEVLEQLRGLASLRRVGLRLASGTWAEPADGHEVHAAVPIQEVLEEGAMHEVLECRMAGFPWDRRALQSLHQHIQAWFDRTARRLSAGEEVPAECLAFLTQLAMLEISLIERRVSRIASVIDPYDMRRIARLLPLLSRYDQDIEHMKEVVSRLESYEPFFERGMTMEQVVTSNEMDKLLKAMSRDVVARNLGRIIEAMRWRPVLDREYACQISQLHQIALLRRQILGEDRRADVLSIMLQVLIFRQEDTTLTLSMEPEIADAMWPLVAGWGARRLSPGSIETRLREESVPDFILPDGTPRLPARLDAKADHSLSLLELVRRQIGNEPFLMGLLDNAKACATPGVISTLARDCRSLRVLDRIIQVARLHAGEIGRDVPRLLLMNPAKTPIASLRRFIHVRYVSKTDLRRLAMRSHDIRPEVSAEVRSYLANLV